MFKDAVGSADVLNVDAGGDASPNWPCPSCGKETVEHRKLDAPDGSRWRICTHSACRHEYESDEPSVLR